MIQGYLVEYDIGLSFHFQSTPKNISFPVIDKVKAGFIGTIACVHKVQQFDVVIANINADSDGVQSTAHEGIS